MLSLLTRLCFAFAAVAVYVVWEKGKEGNVLAPGANGDIWNWRPLKQVHRACRDGSTHACAQRLFSAMRMHFLALTHPFPPPMCIATPQGADGKKFEFPVRWSLGDAIGLLTITCGSFTKMDEELLLLLKVLANVLDRTVAEVEDLTPGDTPPLAKMDEVLAAYEERRSQQPILIQEEVASQLKIFDGVKVFGEIRFLGSDVIEKDTLSMMQGMFTLLGYRKEQCKDWKAIQYLLKNTAKVHDKMMALHVIPQEGEVSSQAAKPQLHAQP